MGGLECLLSLMQNQDNEKLIIKSMFLMNSFAQESQAVRDEFIKLNGIERIIASIEPKNEYNTRLEQTLAALVSLCDTDDSIKRCRNEKFKLKEKLEQVISLGDEKEECQVSRNIPVQLCCVRIILERASSKFKHLVR